MTDLASLMAQSGMSMQDIEILKQATGGGMVDLGLSGPSGVINRAEMPINPTQTNFVAQPTNYKIDPRGNRVGDMMIDGASTYGELSGQFYDGMSKPVRQAKASAGRMIGRGGRKMAGKAGAALGALPGMGKLGAAAKVLGPGLVR